MSKSSITELLSVWRAKYHHTCSRKEKGRIINAIMESTGYKSAKIIIRRLNERKTPPRAPRSGRRKILGEKEVNILKDLWFEMDQPCGKRAALAALRNQIPYKEMLRKVESAGYLSADTVAHCGGDMGGDFV